jgi:hypothetical protein
LIGIASIDFTELLNSTKNPTYGGALQVFDAWFPIGALDDGNVRIGIVRVILSLEDRGVIEPAPKPSSQMVVREETNQDFEEWKTVR